MPEKDEGRFGMFVLGYCPYARHIRDEQVESSGSEIAEVLRRERGAAVSAVIVAVYRQARLHKILDQANVTSDVFA